MKKKYTSADKINIITCFVMLGVLLLFLVMLIVSMGKRVRYDMAQGGEDTTATTTTTAINWHEEYPFEPAKTTSTVVEETTIGLPCGFTVGNG